MKGKFLVLYPGAAYHEEGCTSNSGAANADGHLKPRHVLPSGPSFEAMTGVFMGLAWLCRISGLAGLGPSDRLPALAKACWDATSAYTS